MNLNKVMVYGNITRDPELKALVSGSSVCSFSVATNRRWKDKNGEQKEEVEFHNIVVYGRHAENVAQYMRKGSAIFVEGRLSTRSWEKDGVKRYTTEIIADNTQFGPKIASQTPSDTERNQDVGDTDPDDIPF